VFLIIRQKITHHLINKPNCFGFLTTNGSNSGPSIE